MVKWLSKPFIIVGIGVGVGVITYVIHVIRRKDKEEIITSRQASNRVTRAMKIPKGFVGHVLGRGGANIKFIRDKTHARITFDDQGSDFTVATIVGTPESVDEAANEINKIITGRHATVTQEIHISENISDSIWKNFYCIREICDLSRAKILFEFNPSRNGESTMKAVLKGRKEEVEAATDLIDELVARVEVDLTRSVHVAGRPLPDNLPIQQSQGINKALPHESLIPNSADGYVEVYVSAVDNPNKFWAQMSGSKSIQLDKLATEMTDFYSDEKNKTKVQLNSVHVGEIVAAFFEGDNSWYRSQVLKVAGDNQEKIISVFYLDFGDCAILKPNLVCALKSEYLSIPFQAIECCLADVQPVGDNWSEDAIEAFEKLVYLGQWKVIMAKPVKEQVQNGKMSGAIQYVQLLDTTTERDINVAEKLVSMNYAKFV